MTSHWEVDGLLADAVDELERSLPPRRTEAAMELAVRAMAMRTLRGEMTPRELSRWSHRVVGHTGPEFAQPFVELDDLYDLHGAGYAARTPDELDADVLREAKRLADAR